MGFGDLTSFCGGWHKHKDARIVSREWGLTGRMGGHQHLHPKVTWQERAWCKICMPNNQTGKTLISNPLCGWYRFVAYWLDKNWNSQRGTQGHPGKCQQLWKSPGCHRRSVTTQQVLIFHYLFWVDQWSMDICIKWGQWGVWGDSTPPGWREGWDWTQGGEPRREDPGRNDFSGRVQLGCNSDDTREGAAVGEQCAEQALTLTQCLVLAQSPALAKDRIWYLQLHSHIQGVEHGVTLTVLSDPATGLDCLHNHCGKPHHDLGFYGMGLPHLGVEALIAMSNKLLMHYGCNTTTGRFMQVSYSLFLVELGISFQPLQESYSKYGFLSTHSCIGRYPKVLRGVSMNLNKEGLQNANLFYIFK